MSDKNGRFVILEIEIEKFKCVSTCLYAPNKDDPSFFTDLFEKANAFESPKIYIGDFNLTLNCTIDRSTHIKSNNNNKARDVLTVLMKKNYIVDIWRVRNPNEKRFSWRKNSQENLSQSRIDMALISQ